VVVLSDTHFGDPGALLVDGGVLNRLSDELASLGDVQLLVLLGDIWDLWRTGPRECIRRGDSFLRTLGDLEGVREILVVAGNHDFHLAAGMLEAGLLREEGWSFPLPSPGTVEEVGGGVHRSGDGGTAVVGKGVKAVLSPGLVYPLLTLRVKGRRVLFMHGHHLDFFSSSFWWVKTSWLSRWVLGESRGVALSDLDRLNRPFFELLTMSARAPELRSTGYRLYGVIRFLARIFRFQNKEGGSPRRCTSVGENARECRRLLRELLPGFLPDVFVFGHTHRAGLEGVEVGGEDVLLANTGCWLREDGSNTPATYLVIDECVRLHRLGEGEIAAG
jgi:predicted phosphodiesterase